MRRREFIAGIGVSVAMWPLATHAQQSGRILRIGMLDVVSESINAANIAAFRQGLQQLGYIDGQNLVISYRFARGGVEQFSTLAAELLRQDISVFVTRGTAATLAVKNVTTVIPVVMAASGDPVRAGLVSSLARPGGNVTGLSAFLIDLASKRFELLKEMTGQINRVAFLDNLANPVGPALWEETKIAASALNVEPVLLDVRKSEDLEAAFKNANVQHAAAILVGNDGILTGNRPRIVALAAQHRIPALYHDRAWTDAGGLVSYGVDFSDLYRRSATYVDKIFRGTKPADLPVEQPTKLNLVINLKTAKVLGLTVPPTLIARADEVIVGLWHKADIADQGHYVRF